MTQITKRDGSIEHLDYNKLEQNLKHLCNGLEFLVPILLKEVKQKLHGIKSTRDISDVIIDTAKNLISPMYPEADKVAGRALLQKYSKELHGIKKSYDYPAFHNIVKKGIEAGIFRDDIPIELIEELSEYIEPERDERLNYVGVINMFEKYLIKPIGELPQHGYMRVALAAYLDEYIYAHFKPKWKTLKDYRKDVVNKIVNRYDFLSKAAFTEATPKWVSALSNKQQSASCVVGEMLDDTHSIQSIMYDFGLFSKYGGGLALYFGNLRARGSSIGKLGKSDGMLPYAKLYASTFSAYNQMSKRRGAGIATNDWFNKDIQEFIMLNDKGGTNEQRARELKLGVVINKLFLERVRAGKRVTLFDAKVSEPLRQAKTAEEFEEAYHYLELHTTNEFKKVVDARDLFTQIVAQRKKTGNVYIMFKENMNGHTSPWYETIVQSNLCVAPETKILTDKGYVEIKSVAGQTVNVWNGEEFSPALVAKTGTNQKLLTVETTAGTLECTEYHKFYIKTKTGTKEVRANELQAGNYLVDFNLPNDDEVVNIKVLSIIDKGRYDDTYCFNEPARHMGVFNGILTGQCQEIGLPTAGPAYIKSEYYNDKRVDTKELGRISLCNLASVNVAAMMDMSGPARKRFFRELLEAQDNIIEHAFYPSVDAEWANKKYRPIGIGMTNLAYLFAREGLPMNSSKESLQFMDKVTKIWQTGLLQASAKLAKERGAFDGIRDTKWADPDWVDSFVADKNVAEMVKTYGVRFATHCAVAPTASSALVAGVTEGIEPVSNLFFLKETDRGTIPQVVPELRKLRGSYSLAYETPIEDLLALASVRQKYIDQAQSLNWYETDADKDYSVKSELERYELCYELGIKSLYYYNGKKGEDKEECLSCGA